MDLFPAVPLRKRTLAKYGLIKSYDIVKDCRFGIHDISRTELDDTTGSPRFNMPLELGVFLGAKKFGQYKHKRKYCLILGKESYRYQAFISDISGQDIKAHNNNPKEIVTVVRDWLRTASRRHNIPSGSIIWGRYQEFMGDLPTIAQESQLKVEELIFNDYTSVITKWLRT